MFSHLPHERWNDQKWKSRQYARLKKRKDAFAGGFFSVIALMMLFFIAPAPTELQEVFGFWKITMLGFFIFLVSGWVLTSSAFFKFCIKVLEQEYGKTNIHKKMMPGITCSSPAIIVFSLIASFLVPVTLVSFFGLISPIILYTILGIFALLLVISFLFNIEDFYEKEEELDEIEILAHAIISNDPLGILRGYKMKTVEIHETQKVKKSPKKKVSFKEEGKKTKSTTSKKTTTKKTTTKKKSSGKASKA